MNMVLNRACYHLFQMFALNMHQNDFKLDFSKNSGKGLTEPPPQTPPPFILRFRPWIWASPSILRRFAPSTRTQWRIWGALGHDSHFGKKKFFHHRKYRKTWFAPCVSTSDQGKFGPLFEILNRPLLGVRSNFRFENLVWTPPK